MAEFTRQELSDIALAAAKEGSRQTLSETFALLGVNISDFNAMQQFRDDLVFLRHTRSGAGNIGGKAVLSLAVFLSGAAAIGIWEYLKFLLHIS